MSELDWWDDGALVLMEIGKVDLAAQFAAWCRSVQDDMERIARDEGMQR